MADSMNPGFLPPQQSQMAPGDLGLGSTPPASQPYNQLRDDATKYYLANGGTQANVDSYFQQNPGQNYNKLAADASQWYTGQGGASQLDNRNQNVGNYFGVQPPPSGQNFDYASAQGPAPNAASGSSVISPSTPPGQQAPNTPFTGNQVGTPTNGQRSVPIGSDLRWQGATPEGLMQQFNALDPARQQEYYNYYNSQPANVQQQWRSAFGVQDPSIQSNMAGGQDLLNTPSGLGSPSSAMRSAQTAAPIPGPNGNMHSGDDDGYTAAGGPAFSWEGGAAPQGSYTVQGQQDFNSPFQSTDGTQFNGLQQFLNYMLASTPGSQAIKGKLEGLDTTGGSRETGEGSLFDVLAPYLTANGASAPTSGTPFSQTWNPSSLLQLLMKSGILRR